VRGPSLGKPPARGALGVSTSDIQRPAAICWRRGVPPCPCWQKLLTALLVVGRAASPLAARCAHAVLADHNLHIIYYIEQSIWQREPPSVLVLGLVPRWPAFAFLFFRAHVSVGFQSVPAPGPRAATHGPAGPNGQPHAQQMRLICHRPLPALLFSTHQHQPGGKWPVLVASWLLAPLVRAWLQDADIRLKLKQGMREKRPSLL
jgi:hypothetical protein